MEKYVWCEDTGSGLELWHNVFSYIDPEIIVQTKENNVKLRKSASRIFDDGEDEMVNILSQGVSDNIVIMGITEFDLEVDTKILLPVRDLARE